MAAKIQTQLGYPIPPAPRHSVTVYIPKWENIIRFADRDPTLMMSFKNMYPRMILHADVKMLIQKIVEKAGIEGRTCLPFLSLRAAQECKEFITSPKRGDDAVPENDISIRTFDIDIRYYCIFFPVPKFPIAQPFWMHSGLGTSSRIAEESFKNIDKLREVSENDSKSFEPSRVKEHAIIKGRIANLLERAPAGPPRSKKVSPDDVYLFPSGMSSIYCVHRYLLDRFNATSVLFGFAFSSTIVIFQEFGPGGKFLGLGTQEELDILEQHLKTEQQSGRKVQAIWAEFPSNPLIVTPNLGRVRELADEYGSLLIVDDTIGSFCNIDVLPEADIIVTSLTKSFSGYADAMGGGAVLNPSSKRYEELKRMFRESFEDVYGNGDAIALELNNRDYLTRSIKLNNNALRVTEYLQLKAAEPNSSISRVHYTNTGISFPNYQKKMRQTTEEFTPGYGCLFSVEFKHVKATEVFYDNLNVYHGPHLGAHLTLAIPYVRGLYGKDLPWAAQYGLKETQIRISVGLEDTDILLEEFRIAVAAADAVA